MAPLLPILVALPVAQALLSGSGPHWGAPPKDYDFARFAREFKRSYLPGSEEWARRERLFEGRMQELDAFYSGPVRTWRKGVTSLMDYSDAEYKKILGYKGRGSRGDGRTPAAADVALERRGDLPDTFTTLTNSSLSMSVRDQGQCGSCWAVAAVAALEGHMERSVDTMATLAKRVPADELPDLSEQAMISCTGNPRHCGGTGGCDGATSELGFEMVKKRGLPLRSAWPYKEKDQACDNRKFSSTRVSVSGWTVLPSNKYQPLKTALVEGGGPIVITVDATNWMMYTDGIYTDNGNEWLLNHAVVLVGYKEPKDQEQGYWHIKNSWGDFWGEDGFIRLDMKKDEEKFCGWDNDAQQGIACEGEPKKVWVCGTCGILYDTSYPTGVHIMA